MSEKGERVQEDHSLTWKAHFIELLFIINMLTRKTTFPTGSCAELSLSFFFSIGGKFWCIIKASFAFTSVFFLSELFYSP